MLRICFGLFVALGLLAGCQKSKPYHNLTGRYNAYYNAGLRLTDAFENLRTAHQDNYNQLLPLYPYVEADASGAKAVLDEAITKCAKNITLHRISNWADDTYLYLGQAEFLKKDYEKSTETFRYIIDKYNPDKPKSAMDAEELQKLKEEQKKAGKKNSNTKKKNSKKKKKKKPSKKKKKKPSKKKKPNSKSKSSGDKDKDKDKDDDKGKTSGSDKDKDKNDEVDDPSEEKPKKYGLKHRPNRHAAMLWYAKALIEIKQYDEARLYLRLLDNDINTPRKLHGEIQAVTAHSFLRQKEYQKAIPALELAIERTRRKRVKNRYAYVLAQLYQQQGNSEMAMQRFRDVLKMRPDYTMEFNARLNMAKNSVDHKGGGRTVDPEIAIKRMLRESKNEEYKDQLYFALAEIQLKRGEIEEGIESLEKSMARAGGAQKAEGAWLLADIYYKRRDYVRAYNYYDTASTSLPKEDERTETAKARRNQLKPIAESIQTIALQDSLLRIAGLPFEQQKEWAQRIRKEEAEAKKAATGTQGGKPSAVAGEDRSAAAISANLTNQSNFELYNPNLRKKGERDFEKRWGSRPWGENWRRSKQQESTVSADGGKPGELPPMMEDEVKTFLKNKKVPATDAEKQKVRDDITAAYLRLGTAYREELRDNASAAKTLEELLAKYPASKHELEALYALFGIYTEMGNTAQADACKKRIMEQHPNSDIAKVVQNPDFVGAKQQQINNLNVYYEEVRKMVEGRQFADARERIRAVPAKFPENPLKARFAILEAMCVGGIDGMEAYVKALRSVSTSFPKTPEDEQAKKMVAILTNNKTDPGTSSSTADTQPTNRPDDTEFERAEEVGHYVIILFEDAKAKVDAYKDLITDFNTKHYNLAKLSASPLLIDREFPAIVVRKFKNMQTAKEYLTHAYSSDALGKDAPKHRYFYIGQKNYQTVLQKNNFRSSYSVFFEELNK